MIDKIINAINEIVGGDESGQANAPDQAQTSATNVKSGFVPDDGASGDGHHDGPKGRRLDQLVQDAKDQIGDKPQ